METKKTAVACALLAAALYAINVPFSKILLQYCGPTMLAGLLYLGAGLGMGAMLGLSRIRKRGGIDRPLEKKDLPYTSISISTPTRAGRDREDGI